MFVFVCEVYVVVWRTVNVGNAVHLFVVWLQTVLAPLSQRVCVCLLTVVCDIFVCSCAPRHVPHVFCISALVSSLCLISHNVQEQLLRTRMYGYVC
jgi:hypothetical protein